MDTSKTVLTDSDVYELEKLTDAFPEDIRVVEKRVLAKLPGMPAGEWLEQLRVLLAGSGISNSHADDVLQHARQRIQPAASEAGTCCRGLAPAHECRVECGGTKVTTAAGEAGAVPPELNRVLHADEEAPTKEYMGYLRGWNECRDWVIRHAGPAAQPEKQEGQANDPTKFFKPEALADAVNTMVRLGYKFRDDGKWHAPAAQPEKQAGQEVVGWVRQDTALDEYTSRADVVALNPGAWRAVGYLAAPPSPSQQAAPAAESAGPIKLYDSQWVNIVNHANCWADYSKEDAVHEAVKMTERAIKANYQASATTESAKPVRPETTSEHIARDMREGRFPQRSEPQMVTAATADAQDVDFLTRVLDLLPTWTAEDWNELLERNPDILAVLRPLVNSTADAQPSGNPGELDAQSDERAVAIQAIDEAIDHYGAACVYQGMYGCGGEQIGDELRAMNAARRRKSAAISLICKALSRRPSVPASADNRTRAYAIYRQRPDENGGQEFFYHAMWHDQTIPDEGERMVPGWFIPDRAALAAAKPEGGDHE